jgi:dihydroorotase
MLQVVAGFTARQFARAIVMPNLTPPITTAAAAVAYAGRIRSALPPGSDFQPLMTCYLTDTLAADEVERGWDEGAWIAAKLYPAHATTNSAHGVTNLEGIAAVLERMQRLGMVLCVHGEVTDPAVDVFDREAVFIERSLIPLTKCYPELKIVFEHITTAEAADFVMSRPHHLGATVTAHHLAINRNAMFQGGIRPHHYCLPVAKRERHRLALVKAATSGDARFFLGTDSAPHLARDKESACGCAGLFTAANAVELYAEIFDAAGALDKFEAFASLNGPAFYGLPVNGRTITLERSPLAVPQRVNALGDYLVPFRAGATLSWRLA